MVSMRLISPMYMQLYTHQDIKNLLCLPVINIWLLLIWNHIKYLLVFKFLNSNIFYCCVRMIRHLLHQAKKVNNIILHNYKL